MRRMKVLLCMAFLCLALAGCAKEGTDDYDRGMAAMETEEYTTAISYFEKMVDKGDRKAESYRGLGIAYYKTQDYASAVTMLSRSLEMMEGDNDAFAIDVLYYLGAAADAYGELNKAAEAYTQLLEYSHTADAYYRRGRVYLEQGDKDKASKDFEKAVSLEGRYSMYMDIYRDCVEYEQNSLGEAFLEKALQTEPKQTEDYYYQGWFSYYLGYYDQAQKLLIEAVNADHDPSRLLLGKVYLAMEDTASARSLYQDYLDRHMDSASAYNGLVLCDMADGDYDTALSNTEKGLAFAKDEDRQSLMFNRIVIYENKRDFEMARTLMEEYLKEYPTDEEAKREYVFLQSR